MTIAYDAHITPVFHPIDGPILDLPELKGTSTTAGFATDSSLPKHPSGAEMLPAAVIPTREANTLDRISAYLRYRFSKVRQQASQYRRGIESYLAFSRELLAGPRMVGAVCPSSIHLAQAMAYALGNLNEGLVLELGAGTGSITGALLQRGIAPERLVVIERSAALAAHLRQRFPNIRVIEGDARQLNVLLGNDAGRVCTVVSGLPLRSLKREVVTEIALQVRQILSGGGVLVQFTYDLSKPSFSREKSLKRARTRFVWKNLPPARVDTFIREPDRL